MGSLGARQHGQMMKTRRDDCGPGAPLPLPGSREGPLEPEDSQALHLQLGKMLILVV